MATNLPETRVLAIASHVAYGYVGNTMVTFVLQSLGCEVSAINTVNFSNHTGYKRWTGRKTTAEEIQSLYIGLRQNNLNNYSILISGYIPSADGVRTVGKIGRDLKARSSSSPGSFFWVLDPVMGDEGQLYIPEDEVPVYKSLLHDADLILPNQFEAELLSGTKTDTLPNVAKAVASLHREYQIPHIIITSIRLSSLADQNGVDGLPSTNTNGSRTDGETQEMLSIIGSTATSTWEPRLWRIDIPAFPVYFSGTGDMFAALIAYRLREAVYAAGLQSTPRWISPDSVRATELPSAKAAQMVLASMQSILGKTYRFYKEALPGIEAAEERMEDGESVEVRSGVSLWGKGSSAHERMVHVAKSKAAEVRVVRNVRDLGEPPEVERYASRPLEI